MGQTHSKDVKNRTYFHLWPSSCVSNPPVPFPGKPPFPQPEEGGTERRQSHPLAVVCPELSQGCTGAIGLRLSHLTGNFLATGIMTYHPLRFPCQTAGTW